MKQFRHALFFVCFVFVAGSCGLLLGSDGGKVASGSAFDFSSGVWPASENFDITKSTSKQSSRYLALALSVIKNKFELQSSSRSCLEGSKEEDLKIFDEAIKRLSSCIRGGSKGWLGSVSTSLVKNYASKSSAGMKKMVDETSESRPIKLDELFGVWFVTAVITAAVTVFACDQYWNDGKLYDYVASGQIVSDAQSSLSSFYKKFLLAVKWGQSDSLGCVQKHVQSKKQNNPSKNLKEAIQRKNQDDSLVAVDGVPVA